MKRMQKNALLHNESIQKLREATVDMIETQAVTFTSGDLEGFMQWFNLDIVNDYYARRWFTGYAVKIAQPVVCKSYLKELQIQDKNTSTCEVVFHLQYEHFTSEKVTFHNQLSFEDTTVRIREVSIKLEQGYWKDEPVNVPLLLTTPSLYTLLQTKLVDRAVVRLCSTPTQHTLVPIIVVGTAEELLAEEPKNLQLNKNEVQSNSEGETTKTAIRGQSQIPLDGLLNRLVNERQEQARILSYLPHHLQLYEDDQVSSQWWEPSELTEIAYTSSDALKASLYARAISKSTRYRSTHPEIDSAVIASNMMSLWATKLAFSFGTNDPILYVRQLQEYAQHLLTQKTYSDVRQADRSHFPARELSLQPLYIMDEIFELAGGQPGFPVQVNCPEVAAFYIALLRLQGFGPWDAFILTQPFHYLAFFQTQHGYYIISEHDIMPMNPHRLYGDTEVSRIISTAFYLDQTGLTNMPDALQAQLKDSLRTKIPIFSLPEGKTPKNVLPLDTEPTFSVCTHTTPYRLSAALKQHVFEMSRKYPSSPFTWAKYLHQTLLVPQPQAYLIWSLKAVECKKFAQQYQTIDAICVWMKQTLISRISIFEEADRIMTADQVLRYCKGTAKDRAMLLYTAVCLSNTIQTGGIVLTTAGSYVILKNKQMVVVYDTEKLQMVSHMEGRIVLAFDDQFSYNPSRSDNQLPPPWLELL